MKNLSVIFICLLSCIATCGQFSLKSLPDPSQKQFQIDRLKRSKNQRKVGLILLGSGAGLFAGQGIMRLFKTNGYGDATYGVLGFAILPMLTSIPFFISAHHNRKRAAWLSLKNETLLYPLKGYVVYKDIPALSVWIDL